MSLGGLGDCMIVSRPGTDGIIGEQGQSVWLQAVEFRI